MAKIQSDGKPKLKRKQYEKELRRLQAELCHLQEWVKAKGLRIMIVFEGRDGAGKGGTIRADHGAREPSGFSGRGPTRTIGSRKVADVRTALHATFPRGGRDRDF